MKLRASLFKIKEKLDVFGKNIPLPVESVSPVQQHLYPDEVELGDEKDNGEWIFKTHCRDKEYSPGFLYLGFEIVDLEEKEQGCEFEIKEAVFDEDGQCNEYIRLPKLITIDGKEVYIDLPIVDINIKDDGSRTVNYKSSNNIGALTCSIGSVYAGYAILYIYKKNEDKAYRSLPRILILPSSVGLRDFIEMANDLFEIRSNLIIADKGKTFINSGMSYQIEAIDESLVRLKSYLKRINGFPALGLKDEYLKTDKNHIRKGKSKVWIDMAMYPYKKKFDVLTKKETTNIYENRVIKSALIKMKNIIEKMQTNNIGSMELEERIKNVINNGKSASEFARNYLKQKEQDFSYNDKSDKLIGKLESFKEKKEEYKQEIIDRKKRQVLSLMETEWASNNDLIVNCVLHKNGFLKSGIIINDECIELRIDGGATFINENFGLDTKYGKYYVNDFPDGCKFQSKKLVLSIKSNNYLHIEKLRRVFCEAPTNCAIYINGAVVRKNFIDYSNPLWTGEYDKKYPKYIFEIFDLKELSFNFQPVDIKPSSEDPQIALENVIDYDKEVLKIDDEIANCEERIENVQSYVEKYKDLDNLKKRHSDKIENCLSNIRYVLALPFLKSVDEIKFDWKPTQIFVRHNCYKPVFDILRELDNKIKFTVGFDGRNFAVQKVDQIYEYWCFYKFIDTLIVKMGWKFKDKESRGIIKVLNDYLLGEEQSKTKKKKMRKELIPVKLYFPNDKYDITLEIFHEKRLEARIGESNNLLPDYQLILDVDGNKSYFYLDAKYYKFKEMNHYYPLKVVKEMIQKVSIDKYIMGFESFEHHSSASFIIHSDDTNNNYVNWGGYLDDEVFKDINNLDQLPKAHMAGAFYFLPRRIDNFITYIRMLMEYHLGIFDICWACGNSNKGKEGVGREVRLTSSGYEKYYFKCGNCKDFWVKTHCDTGAHHNLIKHFDGYHKATSDWFVKCPKCNIEEHKGGKYKIEIIDESELWF